MGRTQRARQRAGVGGFTRASNLKADPCSGILSDTRAAVSSIVRVSGEHLDRREQLNDGQRDEKEVSLNHVKHSGDTHLEVPTANVPPVAESGLL